MPSYWTSFVGEITPSIAEELTRMGHRDLRGPGPHHTKFILYDALDRSAEVSLSIASCFSARRF